MNDWQKLVAYAAIGEAVIKLVKESALMVERRKPGRKSGRLRGDEAGGKTVEEPGQIGDTGVYRTPDSVVDELLRR